MSAVATAPDDPHIDFDKLTDADNIVELLTAEQLATIGQRVVDEYNIDEQSRSDWLATNRKAIDLSMMVAAEKNTPFKNASNVKFPLLANAALQFNARAYPAIVPPDRVVKGKTYGKDDDGKKAARADRVAEHMSWQLTAQMPEWEEDTDRLTLIVSLAGSTFRKVFYDPSLKRNVTRLVTADRMVFNYWARSFTDLPRKTELMDLYPNEIAERINDGRFVEFDYSGSGGSIDERRPANDNDSDSPHVFLEQHRLLDLDGDGYEEPYIVTVHKETQHVCRIKANWTLDTAIVTPGRDGKVAKVISIRPRSYYVRYLFLPAPDGGAYGLGFGWLLGQTNEAINTTLNQLFDAGTLSNMQGGFISGALGIKDKSVRLDRGEWRVVNSVGPIGNSIQPIKYDGPSQTLFALMEFLVNAGKELASIKDVLTGETPATAPVGTTLALIEQGLQVFTSIYKRIHRSLRQELALLAELNAENVSAEEYQKFCDDPAADPKADYNLDDMDILPVSDPQSVTKAQKIAKAQAVYSLAENNPTMNPAEATMRVLQALDVEEPDKLMVPPPQPDPEVEALTKRGAMAEVAEKEANAEQKQAAATASLATSVKTLAEAGQIDIGQVERALQFLLTSLTTQHGMEMDVAGQQQAALAGPGGVPGMGDQSGNPMGAQPAPGPGDGAVADAGGAVAGAGGGVADAAPGGSAGAGLPQGAL